MPSIKGFEDLRCWKQGREITKEIYFVTGGPEFEKDFALRGQMRRSAISIVSNIAEGFERDGNKEFMQFLSIAKGSAGELRAQLFVALDQNYLPRNDFERIRALLTENSRTISGLISYLKQTNLRGPKRK
ncbi:MAG: four helix bundle protein [Pyrinomonadaceae bacterium]